MHRKIRSIETDVIEFGWPFMVTPVWLNVNIACEWPYQQKEGWTSFCTSNHLKEFLRKFADHDLFANLCFAWWGSIPSIGERKNTIFCKINRPRNTFFYSCDNTKMHRTIALLQKKFPQFWKIHLGGSCNRFQNLNIIVARRKEFYNAIFALGNEDSSATKWRHCFRRMRVY